MATGTVILNCARISNPNVAVIDQIARLSLGLRRGGCRLSLAGASPELLDLVGFFGLGECLGVEVERQPEQREQLRGVEEEGEFPDPAI
jgi:hypothetical protein